jgi:glycosyltransferase involved in cell wall biosynthesis
MSQDPLVSIVIPTYYRNNLLHQCLESIQECEYNNIETIVIDGSENHAKEIVSKFNAKYYRQTKAGGPSAARAQGVEYSSGKYIHFLDDDDILLTGAISKKLALLEDNKNVGVAYSGIILEDGHNIYSGLSQEEHTILPKKNARGQVLQEALSFQLVPCSNSTLLIRRELLLDIFPMKDGQKDDLWMIVELAQKTEFDFVEEPLIYRHDSDDSEGRSFDAVAEQFLVLEEKSNLYKKFPKETRRKAIADTYELNGLVHLEKSSWSLASITSFAKAFYYKPGFSLPYLGMSIVAIFGSRIWFITARVYVELFLSREHRGNF